MTRGGHYDQRRAVPRRAGCYTQPWGLSGRLESGVQGGSHDRARRARDASSDIARQHKTLVLDLRGNAGGSMALNQRLLGSVMDHEVTIGKRVMRGGQKPEIAKSREKKLFTGNLIVLVDSDSASASELFARVVQLEHRGTVMGDRSSGSVMEARVTDRHAIGGGSGSGTRKSRWVSRNET
jgi:C-terminal processing protease CtpA/Prc